MRPAAPSLAPARPTSGSWLPFAPTESEGSELIVPSLDPWASHVLVAGGTCPSGTCPLPHYQAVPPLPSLMLVVWEQGPGMPHREVGEGQ